MAAEPPALPGLHPTPPLPFAGPHAGPSRPAGFLPARTVHLHATRSCNLACAHCETAAGPGAGPLITATAWRTALPWLKLQGYEQVCITGGEPLVHPQLAALVGSSRAAGLRVMLVSNGLLADKPSPRIDPVLAQLDGLAISFDGPAPLHNRLRGRDDAFARACAALARLADAGLPVGAALSVLPEALPALPELAAQLVRLGARSLQIRPVLRSGRAQLLAASRLGQADAALRLYQAAQELAATWGPTVAVHCSLAPAAALWALRERHAALLASGEPAGREVLARLSDWVNPLVITDDGLLRPLAHHLAPAHDIGPLAQAGDALLARYALQGLPRLRRLVGQALAELPQQDRVLDWADHLARRSRQPLPLRAAAPLSRPSRPVADWSALRPARRLAALQPA